MGITLFKIKLNTPPNHVYTAGDTVSGIITLHTSPDVDLKEGFIIVLYGKATVSWTEHRSKHSIQYIGKEEFFKKSFVQHVKPQQTEYPFTLQIPSIPALPWTVETTNGRVQYGVNAIIKMPWFKLGDKKAKVQFMLRSHLNERIAIYSRNKPYYQGLKSVNSDKVTLSVLSLFTYPGDKLPYTLEIDNTLTERQLGNAKIQLIGVTIEAAYEDNFFGKGEAEILTEETIWVEEIHETGGVNPGELKMNIGKIEIPQNIKATQVECNILRLKYKLRAIMDEISGFRGCGGAATAEVDVVIGTTENIAPMNSQAIIF